MGDDDAERHVTQAADDATQHRRGRFIEPLGIVDEKDDRPIHSRDPQHRCDMVRRGEPLLRLSHATGQVSKDVVERVAAAWGAARLPREVGEEVPDRRERDRHRILVAHRASDTKAPRRRAVTNGVEQARLADPRLAGDQYHS